MGNSLDLTLRQAEKAYYIYVFKPPRGCKGHYRCLHLYLISYCLYFLVAGSLVVKRSIDGQSTVNNFKTQTDNNLYSHSITVSNLESPDHVRVFGQ